MSLFLFRHSINIKNKWTATNNNHSEKIFVTWNNMDEEKHVWRLFKRINGRKDT